MSYKVTKKDEAVTYKPANHYDMRATRLHNADDVNGSITLGFSHFLPGGGAEMGKASIELLYFVVDGCMTVTTDDGQVHVLNAGDSIHFSPGQGRESKNNGAETAAMLGVSCPGKDAK